MWGLVDTCSQNTASVQDWLGQGSWFWNTQSAREASFHVSFCLRGFRCAKASRTSLGSRFLLSSTTTCLSPATRSLTASVLPPWAPCGHFYMPFSFLFPHLYMKEKRRLCSFIPQIGCSECCLCILLLGLFLLHFYHLSERRRSSLRAGAWCYLVFVEGVQLIVAFVKSVSLETHWHVSPHLERVLSHASFCSQFRNICVLVSFLVRNTNTYLSSYSGL